ncbi:MAG: hypothetical protein ACK4UN_09725 [Limisphaerales bacterium]
MIVATGIAFGHMECKAQPPTEKALPIALRNIVITRWNSSARQLWRGVYLRDDGNLSFRGDAATDYLQGEGQFFSMN